MTLKFDPRGRRHIGMRRTIAISFMLALVTSAVPAIGATPRSTVTNITPDEFAASVDFSSTFRGYWWDFEDEQHFAIENSHRGWTAEPVLRNGWFQATSLDGGTRVRLNNTWLDGAPTNPVAEEHQDTPFDPAFRYVNVRMCSSKNTSMHIRWITNGSLADQDYGGTEFVAVRKGCRTYKFDLVNDRNPDLGTLGWQNGGFTALEMRPTTDGNVDIKIDYVTLNKATRGQAVQVDWTPASQDVVLFFSSNRRGTRRVRIPGTHSGGSMTWNTPNLAPGQYWIVVKDSGFKAVRDIAGPFVVNGPPQGKITAPSYTSGEEWATSVRGDAWDMSNKRDVAGTVNLSSAVFQGGSFVGVNLPDPTFPWIGAAFRVAVPTDIDTTKYRYLTYRMWMAGEGRLDGTGGVARWVFFTENDLWSTTDPVRVYKGWRTVSMDMPTTGLVKAKAGVWGDAPVMKLRLDPHEAPFPRKFKVDWVKLNAMDVAQGVYTIKYTAADAEGDTIGMEFFHGTDRDYTSRSQITCRTAPPNKCRWNTRTVTNGEHYVYMKLTDPQGNVSWVVSEAPVSVEN